MGKSGFMGPQTARVRQGLESGLTLPMATDMIQSSFAILNCSVTIGRWKGGY